MKKTLCLIIVALLTFCFASCTGNNDRSYGDELIIWTVDGPLISGYEGKNTLDARTTKFIIDKFHESYPDVKITLADRGKDTDLQSALQTAYITNDMPDIVVGESFIKSQINLGYFSEIELKDDIKNNIRPELLALSQWEGKQYGVPFYAGVDELLYNESVLRTALGEDSEYFDSDGNFKVPGTMNELLIIAQTVKNSYNDNTHGGIQINNVRGVSSAFRATYIMSAFGGSWLDGDGKLNLTTEENVKAFEYMRSMVPAASFGATGFISENDIITQFLNGNVAFSIDHPSMIADYTKGDIKVAALPSSGNSSSGGVLVGTCSFMMTKECVNPPAAQAFLEILVSKDVQDLIYTQSSLRLPVRTDTQAELLRSTDPAVLAVHDKYLPGLRTLYEGDLVSGLPYFNTNQYTQIWNDNWTEFIGKVFTSTDSVTSLLETLQSNIGSKIN